jgi:hypothetical protein
MERLTKYLVVIYSVLIILTILLYTFNALYNNYVGNYVPAIQYDSQGKPMVAVVPTDTSSFYLRQGIAFLLLSGFPIFIIIMSALYLYKEKEGYFRSLLIPASFAIIGWISSFVWLSNFAIGEEGMAALYIWPMLLITLVISLVVNAIILSVVKR